MQSNDTVAEVRGIARLDERAITRGDVHIPGGIDREATPRLPDSARVSVARGGVDGDRTERCCVVREYPAVKHVAVAPSAEADEDPSVRERERRALELDLGAERKRVRVAAASGARDGDAHTQFARPAEFLGAGGEIERVQSKVLTVGIQGLRDDVDRARGEIDHRRAEDSDLGNDVVAIVDEGVRHRRPEADLPVGRGCRGIVGVECVHSVVHRRGEDEIARPARGDLDARNVERLRVELAVDLAREDQAERRWIHVRRGELRLVQHRARAVVVVVMRPHCRRGNGGY